MYEVDTCAMTKYRECKKTKENSTEWQRPKYEWKTKINNNNNNTVGTCRDGDGKWFRLEFIGAGITWMINDFDDFLPAEALGTVSCLSHFREPCGAASVARMWFSIVLSLLLMNIFWVLDIESLVRLLIRKQFAMLYIIGSFNYCIQYNVYSIIKIWSYRLNIFHRKLQKTATFSHHD